MITSQKLFEAKNYSSLYHIIDLEKLAFIIKHNMIKNYKFAKISTTRNKMMNGYLGDSPVSIFKLELDAEKLSQNYKIKPFAETYTEVGSGEHRLKKFQEWEEQIQTNEIKDIDKYVNKLIIIKDKIEGMKDWGWFDTDGGHFQSGRISIPEYFRKFLPKVKFPIYVQEGSVIKKDDEWIESIKNHELKEIHHGYALAYKGQIKMEKKENWKYPYYLDHIEFIDNRNEIKVTRGENLTIGYDYDNLHLLKDKESTIEMCENYDFELEDKGKIDSMVLRLFDFEYEVDDVIDEDNNSVHVKKACLKNAQLAEWYYKVLIKKKVLV